MVVIQKKESDNTTVPLPVQPFDIIINASEAGVARPFRNNLYPYFETLSLEPCQKDGAERQ